jgi:protein TonB
MSLPSSAAAEVFSVTEVARAAGVVPDAVRALIDSGRVQSLEGYVSASEAVRSVRLLRRGMLHPGERELFAPPLPGQKSPGTGIAASGALHAGVVGAIVLLTSLGLTSPAENLPERISPARLVFLAKPGPGGGGGGGGLKHPKPPARAEMKGAVTLKSPVPPPKPITSRKPEPQVKRPDPPDITPRPVPPLEPPPPAPRPVLTPQVIAPVVTASADARDRAGVLAETAAQSDSQGSGSGGGAGTGQGSGIGEGSGAGIGPGEGGGTGGGPYRPGSGITAPDLLREVRPDYTEDARRMGVEGDVVLEIIVRRDGTVGDIKVLHGLPGGLDRRAVDAVRQWRFAPARRHGTPVDVLVEVAVEFKLR